jgi:hypothetical protein
VLIGSLDGSKTVELECARGAKDVSVNVNIMTEDKGSHLISNSKRNIN